MPPSWLLILDQMLRPTNDAACLLAEMRNEAASDRCARVATAALFVLALSQVDTALVEALGYVLRRNPWKMDFGEIPSKRADVLSVELVRELLESRADELVRKWLYGSKEALFDLFVRVLGLPTSTLAETEANLTALRDRRNKILHTGRIPQFWLEFVTETSHSAVRNRLWQKRSSHRLLLHKACSTRSLRLTLLGSW